jgi:hypothetical protein
MSFAAGLSGRAVSGVATCDFVGTIVMLTNDLGGTGANGP